MDLSELVHDHRSGTGGARPQPPLPRQDQKSPLHISAHRPPLPPSQLPPSQPHFPPPRAHLQGIIRIEQNGPPAHKLQAVRLSSPCDGNDRDSESTIAPCGPSGCSVPTTSSHNASSVSPAPKTKKLPVPRELSRGPETEAVEFSAGPKPPALDSSLAPIPLRPYATVALQAPVPRYDSISNGRTDETAATGSQCATWALRGDRTARAANSRWYGSFMESDVHQEAGAPVEWCPREQAAEKVQKAVRPLVRSEQSLMSWINKEHEVLPTVSKHSLPHGKRLRDSDQLTCDMESRTMDGRLGRPPLLAQPFNASDTHPKHVSNSADCYTDAWQGSHGASFPHVPEPERRSQPSSLHALTESEPKCLNQDIYTPNSCSQARTSTATHCSEQDSFQPHTIHQISSWKTSCDIAPSVRGKSVVYRSRSEIGSTQDTRNVSNTTRPTFRPSLSSVAGYPSTERNSAIDSNSLEQCEMLDQTSSRRDRIEAVRISNAGSEPDGEADRNPVNGNILTCEICERTFDLQSTFDSHMAVFHRRSATPTKPRSASFTCQHCGKGFTSPSKVNVHVEATHLGMRPFQCDLCNKCFGYKGDLTKHKATHSGLKEHTCYICGAKFGRNFYVKRHILTVHEKQDQTSH